MTALFTPFTLKSVTLRNRIAVPPMCQYSAVDGVTNDWHRAHYASIARGGAGLVIVEATAVTPEGRITPGCAGLWNDEQVAGMAAIAAAIKDAGAVAGIQIGHAGRKASANRPWDGNAHIPNDAPDGWQTIAPSALAFGGDLPKVPQEMTLDDIARVRQGFVDAARRALAAGFEWLELHFAHGYLAQSFLSPHSNRRDDQYGGDLDGRGRFLLETLAAVREVWPQHLPLTARMGVIEYDGSDEETLAESIELTRRMREAGLDMLNVSVNFTVPDVKIPWGPGFLAPVARRVKNEAGLPVASSWYIGDPQVANQAVLDEQMDLVMIGREHLADPHYAFRAAKELGVENPFAILPPQYGWWLERYR
ncbi:2,4-dienoyl-CoA reductase-like NADH-dependent reductase (Old Yellow Enzyme family) [Massilia sp. UYP32]|uniref:NADH:flavin oxidoreductase/NADH oxidase n=1 Tax=unclassified Massilia TaxID=2609279 RepID=UPI001C638D6F|nr:NADH:flavin oxidoreductase/NADH oxidase [Massilia sp. NP310]QYG00506.1 NADH:flavin oxidoreductase/NADH oxidase [Massilia sp. NP310]